MAHNKIMLPRASCPEEVGVSSKEIARFMQHIKDGNIRFHSFMVIRHGKVAAECYFAPYNADTPHQMYSVSKSVTSTAVGLCVQEGLLSVEDRIVDIFPDYVPKEPDENLSKLKVRHLLSMTSGKNVSFLSDKTKNDQITEFLKAPWYNEPGAEFRYINENIYMLCAIVHRVTGQTVRDYLQPRLFEPLGIEYPQWETDAYNVEAGGWGIFLKTEDLAKLMLMYHQGGVFNGQRILSEEWVKTATSKVTDNSNNSGLDSTCGYGYCFWQNHFANSYRSDGMFTQLGIVFSDYDAMFICTAGISCEDNARSVIWPFFPRAFFDENAPHADTSFAGLDELLKNAVMDQPLPKSSSPWEKRLEGTRIRMRKNVLLNLIGFPVSMLPLAVVYMSCDKAGNIDNIEFSFSEKECSMTWTEGSEKNTVLCGMDGHYRYGTMRLGQMNFTVCCSAHWSKANELIIDVRPLNTIGKRRLSFSFSLNDRVVMRPSGEPPVAEIAANLAEGVPGMFKNKALVYIAQQALYMLPTIVEPKHRGKIIRK